MKICLKAFVDVFLALYYCYNCVNRPIQAFYKEDFFYGLSAKRSNFRKDPIKIGTNQALTYCCLVPHCVPPLEKV